MKYVAANGAKMDNYGEKRVRFKEEGLNGINSMVFQVTDEGKLLAFVSGILDKGNSIVFSRGPKGSCVVNDQTGRRIPLVEENGTLVEEVEYLQPHAHVFCPVGRLRLDDTFVGQDLPERPGVCAQWDQEELCDEPNREEVVQEHDEVEDLQRGERVPVRVQDPKLSAHQEVDEHNLTHFTYRLWCCH